MRVVVVGCGSVGRRPAGLVAADPAATLVAVVEVARGSGRVLQTGFNHRFYPSIKKARQLVREGWLNASSKDELTLGGRSPYIGHPPSQSWRFADQEHSWEDDWAELAAAVREGHQPDATGEDGWRAVQMAYAVYEASASGRVVRL